MTIGFTNRHLQSNTVTKPDVLLPFRMGSYIEHIVAVNENTPKLLTKGSRVIVNIGQVQAKICDTEDWKGQNTAHQLTILLINLRQDILRVVTTMGRKNTRPQLPEVTREVLDQKVHDRGGEPR